MKQKKSLAILISLILAVSLFTGCSPGEGPVPSGSATEPASSPSASITESNADPEDQSITITDMTGREVTLAEPASRIVALTPSDCEILFAIGAGEGLVGRGEYCNYPEAVLEVPAVQSGANTNLEQIIDLAPQVLLMSTMAQSKEQVATLEAAGIQVVVSDADDIEGVYTAISMIGTLMGKFDQAQALIDSMKASFLSVSAKADEWAGKSIYFEVSPLEWGLWTAGSSTFMDEIARMIGLDNIFADVEGWAEVSEEQVLARDPDYILTISMYFGEGPKPVEEILGRTGWENVSAVKNMALLNLPNDELS
ncbi:MAG TPA: ABC transporter substrate-binding protein, partial [Clostridia bacterium]|nr:ABC transporter substrate-binding protein [Clostridia bacterium]